MNPLREGLVPVADQARQRGVAVPVGRTAGDLRHNAYVLDDEVPDHAVLRFDPFSPTGFAWCWGFSSEAALWSLAV